MSHYLTVALEVAQRAKTILLASQQQFKSLEVKPNNSVVTELDRQIEEEAKSIIHEHFPDHGFYGEETAREALEAEYVWIVDPIDGTREFTRGLPFFSTLVALKRGEEFIVGVSMSPRVGELIYAEKGAGAWRNGERIQVSSRSDLRTSFVVGPAYKYLQRTNSFSMMAALAEDVQGTRNVGAYPGYSWVAAGHAEAMIEVDTFIYDVAPFITIITEAGGKVTDLQGNPLSLDSTHILASNGVLHEEILEYFAGF
ncbi:inositol monophosphatase [Candidatus Woesebacteria bacterium]|nr:inositol monophosphatase [Candidatus Woesebacteria bacterium]MCD8506966.1 inositol monophosphatase [Candidatus Woesebacteria bacterium]MCD8527257.1 inositol monophosphatase [Candidatus Woesebacteria bacterium]MCD8546624.1 inositol monophosphatase [Candidatus Woesebacteria bacterium]